MSRPLLLCFATLAFWAPHACVPDAKRWNPGTHEASGGETAGEGSFHSAGQQDELGGHGGETSRGRGEAGAAGARSPLPVGGNVGQAGGQDRDPEAGAGGATPPTSGGAGGSAAEDWRTPPTGCSYLYDAALGTLPEAQGFTLNQNGSGDPAASVLDGLLSSKSVNSSRFWFVDVASLSFADKPSLEVALFLESSNYISNIGTGTREGYYLSLCAANQCHSVGLASEGYNINTISVPDHPLTPFAIAGEFHVYRVAVDSSGLSLSIDGQAVASGVTPESTPASNRIEFGGGSGASRNVSLLAWACVRTTND